MSNHLATGLVGEKIATKYLKKKGYKILERNCRDKYGELDIICKKQDIIIFIEVKTMSSDSPYGSPFEKVNYYKVKKLKQNAMLYLIKNNYPEDRYWQIDVIGITLDYNTRRAEIEHLEDVIQLGVDSWELGVWSWGLTLMRFPGLYGVNPETGLYEQNNDESK